MQKMMKNRVLKLFKKAGLKDYAKTWSLKHVMEVRIEADGTCNDYEYYTWAMLEIHYNTKTDKLILFADDKRIDESNLVKYN